jgi:hypothetical protein
LRISELMSGTFSEVGGNGNELPLSGGIVPYASIPLLTVKRLKVNVDLHGSFYAISFG